MKRILFVLALVFVVPVNAPAQAPFYQDKTIRIVAGYGAGSVDDAWTRLIARYLAKHIPGNPNMIVQNMPGAGAMIAANYVYKIAKPDGLTLGGIRGGLRHGIGVQRPAGRGPIAGGARVPDTGYRAGAAGASTRPRRTGVAFTVAARTRLS